MSKKSQKGGKGGNEEKKASEVFQAFVICEDFNQTFQPLNLKTPRCLLPVANREPLSYILDHLVNHCRLQQIYLIYKNYGQRIKNFVKSKFRVNTCKFEFVKLQCESSGDVFRYMDEKNIIKDQKGPPFLFVNACVLTNLNLKGLYEQHRKLAESNSYAAMTMIMTESNQEERHSLAHDQNNKILSFRPSNDISPQHRWDLDLSIFKAKIRSRVNIR